MLRATFLGHQGWLVRGGDTHVLVDPLLGAGFGHGGLCGELYPPRRLDLAAFPAIDAVVLSHEHDDHFDVPSLLRLDRRIPIYFPERGSIAGRGLLRELGFAVRPLAPAADHAIGELRLRTFVADHRGADLGDEWEVAPMILRDRAGDGALASSIDVPPPPAMLAALGELAPRPGIWAHASNTSIAAHQRLGATTAAPPSDAAAITSALLQRYAAIERAWGAPAALAIVGGGWSFPGERAWQNHAAFPVEGERLAAALAAVAPDTRCLAALPGTTLTMVGGELVGLEDEAPFVAALPRERWPARDYRPGIAAVAEYGPASGERGFDERRLGELFAGLDDLARHLYGGALFRALMALDPGECGGRLPAIALRLRQDPAGAALVLRYDPSACCFRQVESAAPSEEFVGGIECWASDLLGLFAGELGPSALCYAGRLRVWNHAPRRLWVSPHLLWTFAHPLRRPAATARLYRRLVAAAGAITPVIRGA
ncbi:MAG: MBL fold metallo-hydrolase [Myxococcales bacterium]|nr:MBL fold metallo-hydrolase [Myxococcales bacterium]